MLSNTIRVPRMCRWPSISLQIAIGAGDVGSRWYMAMTAHRVRDTVRDVGITERQSRCSGSAVAVLWLGEGRRAVKYKVEQQLLVNTHEDKILLREFGRPAMKSMMSSKNTVESVADVLRDALLRAVRTQGLARNIEAEC